MTGDRTWDITNAILVFEYDKAEPVLRELSDHGGDEDYLAVLPASWPGLAEWIAAHGPEDDDDYDEAPWWAAAGTRFGCCSVSRHRLPTGEMVLIGAHA